MQHSLPPSLVLRNKKGQELAVYPFTATYLGWECAGEVKTSKFCKTWAMNNVFRFSPTKSPVGMIDKSRSFLPKTFLCLFFSSSACPTCAAARPSAFCATGDGYSTFYVLVPGFRRRWCWSSQVSYQRFPQSLSTKKAASSPTTPQASPTRRSSHRRGNPTSPTIQKPRGERGRSRKVLCLGWRRSPPPVGRGHRNTRGGEYISMPWRRVQQWYTYFPDGRVARSHAHTPNPRQRSRGSPATYRTLARSSLEAQKMSRGEDACCHGLGTHWHLHLQLALTESRPCSACTPHQTS